MDDIGSLTISCEQVHPILVVSDVRASVAFYTDKLGFVLGFTWGDPPRTAGVNLGEISIHLRQGTPSATSSAIYFVVDAVDELYQLHKANGVAPSAGPTDQPWGMREYELPDPDGHRLQFGQHLAASEPKLAIERVDVPVRLEKRLAAVLDELAVRKRMTVSECLEEVLLHSFEKRGDGLVASPHTDGQLAYVQRLKQDHGLDYDAHDGYRFSEHS